MRVSLKSSITYYQQQLCINLYISHVEDEDGDLKNVKDLDSNRIPKNPSIDKKGGNKLVKKPTFSRAVA